jgi:hypothetical protein
MANESQLFFDQGQIGEKPKYSGIGLEAFTDDGRRWFPLYEGKMMSQYDHRHGSFAGLLRRPGRGGTIPNPTPCEKANPTMEVRPWYFVLGSEVDNRLAASSWSRDWLLVWRFGTKPSNERTLISTVLPRSATPHVLSAILFDVSKFSQKAACLVANLNSLLVDLACRVKMSRQGLDSFILKQLPIFSPSFYEPAALSFILPRVLELAYTSHSMAPFARDLGYDGSPFIWDEDRRAQLRAELDAWYALAYGLSRDELRYVLDPKAVMGADYPSETFRVLQKNEIAKYGEYRTAHLVLAAYDRLVSEGKRPRTEDYR